MKRKHYAPGKATIQHTPHSDPGLEALTDKAVERVPDTYALKRTEEGILNSEVRQVNLRTTPIAWGIPMDEVMFSKFLSNFFRLGYMPWDSVATTESTYLPDARNQIHLNYLRSMPNIPYLFMLDSDVLPPPNIVNRLISYDLPIVGGWYKGKKAPRDPIVYDYVTTDETGKLIYRQREKIGHGLEKVDGAGAGCWLMRRDVAEALGDKPFDMNSGGEDLLLCKKIYDLGFNIHIDWDLACAHIGSGLY